MKTVAANRKARFDYEILDTVEAGIALTGPEVKSCRLGQVQLPGSYVTLLRNRPVLRGMKIARYAYLGPDIPYEIERERTLLMHHHEIEKLNSAISEQGITVIPLEVRAGRTIKIVLGIARGRKRIDKRQHIKERETGRRLREGKEI